MAYATAPDGTHLYYEEIGAGEPLLLISGQGSDHSNWNIVRKDFARRYRVIVFDHRGTGQSDKPETPPYTTRGFAQDTIAILDHLGIARAHAYGVSMGGRICQWLGIDFANRIGALVLGCTTPGGAHSVKRPSEVDAAFQSLSTDPQGAMATLVDTLFTPAWVSAHPDFIEFMGQEPLHPVPAYAQRLHYLASEGHNAWDLLPTIKTPTLIIHGSDDVVNPTANAPLLANHIPNAELYIVEKGRHGYFIEFREEASKVVLEFLARHPM